MVDRRVEEKKELEKEVEGIHGERGTDCAKERRRETTPSWVLQGTTKVVVVEESRLDW